MAIKNRLYNLSLEIVGRLMQLLINAYSLLTQQPKEQVARNFSDWLVNTANHQRRKALDKQRKQYDAARQKAFKDGKINLV